MAKKGSRQTRELSARFTNSNNTRDGTRKIKGHAAIWGDEVARRIGQRPKGENLLDSMQRIS